MNLLIRILLTAVLVMVIAHFFPSIATVTGFKVSIVVAVVLGLLNLVVKPILVLFTLPVTIVTLGLFLLVINAVIILLCSRLVTGFHVGGFLDALLFSVILSVFQSVVFSFSKDK